ncbi:isopentenyl-diphosphate delta-isomerase 2 [Sigmodon hispidus]
MHTLFAGLLHRGFSVVLFNTKNQLLVQQRADVNYTFPGHFTDSCSSHSLHTPDALEEKEAVGVRRVALRHLQAELGIPQEQISIQDIIFMNRIYHRSPSDDIWGEYEIGYLLLVRKDLTLSPDAREVKSYRYMRQRMCRNFWTEEPVEKRGSPHGSEPS